MTPQSLMLTFFGIHVLERPVAVWSGSVIEVFARIGVSQDAVRTTLGRMVRRGLLERHPRGRRTYFGLTPSATTVLRDGHRRIWETGAVNRDWDGTWTTIAFSLPDTRRDERHALRSRLVWAGFAPVQGGLWIAAGPRDVAALVDPLGLREHVLALSSRALPPSADADLVRRAFDLDRIAARYDEFLTRWGGDGPAEPADDVRPDALARQLLLQTDWLELVRLDPHLPVQHLPAGWPALRAEDVFRRLAAGYEEPARRTAAELMDTLTLAVAGRA